MQKILHLKNSEKDKNARSTIEVQVTDGIVQTVKTSDPVVDENHDK